VPGCSAWRPAFRDVQADFASNDFGGWSPGLLAQRLPEIQHYGVFRHGPGGHVAGQDQDPAE
jgi:hypothetical protein